MELPLPSSATADLARVRARLGMLRTKMAGATLVRGAVLGVLLVATVGTVVLGAEAVLWMPPLVRLALFALVLALFAAPLLHAGAFVWRALTGRSSALSDATLARHVGHRNARDGERLLTLVQLDDHAASGSGMLAVTARDRMSTLLNGTPFENAIRPLEAADYLARWTVLALVPLMAWCAVSPQSARGAADRLFSPAAAFARPAPFTLTVSPGDVEVTAGDTVRVEVSALGGRPSEVWVESKREGEEAIDRIRLLPSGSEEGATYTGALGNVRYASEYRVVADPVESNWYSVDVANPPVVRSLQLELVPPRYSGLPPMALDPGVGDVAALPGTQVRIALGLGGGEAGSAHLDFEGRADVDLELGAGRAAGSFSVGSPDAYRVVVDGTSGRSAQPSATFYITPLADAPPTIRIASPDPSIDLDNSRRVVVRGEASDDFGLDDARLVYRLTMRAGKLVETEYTRVELALEPGARIQQIVHSWDLGALPSLTLSAGDEITYYLEARDNNSVRGSQIGRSATHRLRLPGLNERFDALDEQEDALERSVRDLDERSDDAREQFEQLRRELRQNRDATWESQQALQSAEQRQQQLEEQARALTEATEELGRTMEEQGLMSEQTREQYEELRRVMEELASPELQEALEQLREAMEELDLSQMQQAMDEFDQGEQQLQQRLDRAMELMKNLRIQRELEELAARAEELADEQAAIEEDTKSLDEQNQPNGESESSEENGSESESESGENSESGEESQSGEQSESSEQSDSGQQSPSQEELDELAERQEAAAEKADSLNAELDELRERMQDARSADENKLDQIRQQSGTQATSEQMRQTAEQMQQGQTGQQQQQQQQQSQQQMRQLQSQLQQMQQQMQEQKDQLNITALRRALDDVLLLSEQQESLRYDVQSVAGDSPVLRDGARAQTQIRESFEVVIDTLTSIASRAPNVTRAVQRIAGDGLREMRAATDELGERRPSPAAARQRAAMTQLNELALRLSKLLDQAMSSQNSQSGSGQSMQQMMQQLQQMGQQQQGLNQQIQQHLNQTAGERKSGQGAERLRQIGEQQARIRRELREMSRNLEGNGEGAEGQMLRQMEDAAQQMAETIDQLSRGQADRPLLERQQRILTRLLQAQNASQQRGEEEKREGRPGDEQPRPPGTPLPPPERAEQLRRDLIRALESGYAPEYEALIRRYFETLREQEQPR